MEHVIAGSGGGDSSSGRSAIDAPDSLRSREFTRIVDLISEGEIGGLVEGLKSVYINGTPLENADNTKNFTGVTVVERVGTPNQTFVPGFQYAETETSVATDVVHGTPIVRSISNPNVDNARVRVAFPAVSKVDSTTGDSLGSYVYLTVEVQSDGGAYKNVISDVVSGKSTGKYIRQYAIPLAGDAPWNIRVTRVTADSTSDYEQNTFRFDSYSEVIDVKLRRPNLAAYYIQADSSQFSTVPTRSYKCYGRIIRVPSNYNEVTRTYTGIWDGTFKLAYSNCPPWVFMDLVTHSRYGLAKFIQNVVIDKWRLYEIAKYCDGMVDNGFGGVEPRYTVNMYIQSQQQAYSLLNDLASAFESMPSYSGDSLHLIQDSPRDATFVYTPANVIDGKFQYSGSSRNARHSVARVTYNDPLNHYKRDVVLVIDDDLVKKLGYRTTDIVAIGCTSRGQANRKGRRILYTEAVETETVTFSVGLDSLRVEPGQVFKVADPIKTSGSRCGGRLTTESTTSILNVDDWASPGTGATITVMLPEGVIEKRNVSSVAGLAITLATPLSAIPIDGAVWIANGSNATERYWRVLNITEKTGKDKLQFDITALAYDPTKYAQIDAIGPIVFQDKPNLPSMAQPPANISFQENVVVINNQALTRINVSWDVATAAKSYLFKYKVDNGNWVELQTLTPAYQIDVQSGSILYVAVGSIGAMGYPTPSMLAQHDIIGENNKPVAPLNLELEDAFTGNGLRVKWDFLQRLRGYNILIRSGSGHAAEPVLPIDEEPDYSGDSSVLRSGFIGIVQRYEYTSEFMLMDTGNTPVRTVTIRLQSVGANGLRSDVWTELVASNPAPAALSDIIIQALTKSFMMECTMPSEVDYDSIIAWMSTTNGFTTSDANLVTVSKTIPVAIVTDGSGNPIVPDTVYYFRFAAFDTFGRSDLNISAQYSVTALDNVTSSYLHIRYSNDGGSTFTASGGTVPGAYIGTYADDSPTASTSVGAYTWALIKGADGTNGTPGSPGSNGQTTYLHIKYSNDGGSTFTASSGEVVGAYIGTLTDFTLADSSTPSDYVWALIKGADGTNGTPGTPGPNGQSTYLHIKYSNDGGSTFTGSGGEDVGAYIGTYTDFTLADSTSVGAYTWALIKGADGTNGTPGTPGPNGQSTYLHIKYSNDGGSTFTSSSGETVGAYIGTYTDFTLADSMTITDYTWALIKGADGTNGTPGTPGPNGQATYVHIKYSDDGGFTFTASSGETPGKYIGTYTDFTLADSNTVTDYTWALIKGSDGQSAVAMSLSSSAVTLQADSSGVVGDYSLATTTAKVMLGASDDSSNWTFSKTNGSGVTSNISGAVLTVSALSIDSSYVDITATRSGYATQTARFSMAKARAAAPSSGVPSGLFWEALGGSAAGIRFNTDGTVSTRDAGGTYSVIGNWYTPTTSGIGSSYWIKLVPRSGSANPSSGSAINSWVAMSSTVGWVNTVIGINSRDTVADFFISTSSGGSPIVATGTLEITADTT